MRPTLLKSFSLAAIFWFIVTTLWWSFQQPQVHLDTLLRLKQLLPFLPITVPAHASILESIGIQLTILTYWTIPLLGLSLVSGVSGFGLMWLKNHGTAKERTAREQGTGNFRGVTLTVGPLPEPLVFPRHEINLDAEDGGALAHLTEAERRLLEQILGTLAAHPDAYAGDGISGALLDHALLVVEKALVTPRRPGLSAIVAASYEMGKIHAYIKKDDGSWVLKKRQDYEGSRILATLPAWFNLPATDKSAVLMAVRYHDNSRYLPDPEGDVMASKLARELLSVSGETSAEVVVQEKQKTLERTLTQTDQSLSDIIFDALIQALPQLSFQNRGLPKGVRAVAWKMKSRVYLLEIALRETVSAKLPLEVRGALTPDPRKKSRLQPFTVELLKALQERGWLVTTINGVTLEPKDALWNVKAGKLDFRGVIAVDVPAEYLAQLPSDDSMYELLVTGSLFATTPGMSISMNDLVGNVLKKPEPAPAPEDV